jgi:hypothetical protein
MRASLLAIAMFFGAALPVVAADARGPDTHTVPLRLHLGLEMPRPSDEDSLLLRPSRARAGARAVTFSLGPFRTRLGGDGKKMSIAHYNLEGLDLFGGSISGRLDGRGARIYVRWPPGDDE